MGKVKVKGIRFFITMSPVLIYYLPDLSRMMNVHLCFLAHLI